MRMRPPAKKMWPICLRRNWRITMSIKNAKPIQRKAVEAVNTVRAAEEKMLTQTSGVKSEEIILEDFDIADLKQVDIRHKNVYSTVKGTGCLTVVNHRRCGHRVHLANIVWRTLGCPVFVKIFLKRNKMFILPDANEGIAVRFDRKIAFEDAVNDYNGKIVLYATETVKSLTSEWDLDFDKNCCYTGGAYKKCTINGAPAIVIYKEEAKSVEQESDHIADDDMTEV